MFFFYKCTATLNIHTNHAPLALHDALPFCYKILQRPLLWNGMFDRHRAEITVMQFTGHSLPVHQFVTVPWDFNPVPFCQPSSPTPMEYALPPSLEWHVWPGRRSINILQQVIRSYMICVYINGKVQIARKSIV